MEPELMRTDQSDSRVCVRGINHHNADTLFQALCGCVMNGALDCDISGVTDASVPARPVITSRRVCSASDPP